MPHAVEDVFLVALQEFAERVTVNFAVPIEAHPEDQLKTPIQNFLQAAGEALGHDVQSRTEARADEVAGRPDLGVAVGGLLAGHIELKAPGKGAQPRKFKGAYKEQWEKFQALPNLIYTDGSEWALYRSGERVGPVVRFSGDASTDGADAFTTAEAEKLRRLFQDYFLWEPLVPDSPRALAEMLAPLCHLLREDVLLALADTTSAISQLAREWRETLFPDADDRQFADAYAQTVTYALLLARLIGETDIRTARAAAALDSGHGLLAQALRVLGDRLAEKEIGLGIGLLERVIDAVDPRALTRKGRDPWLYFYEDFLAAYDPKLRKDRGVYYTPVEVIRCQCQLVSQLLEEKFDEPLSFAGDDVVLLDPGAGTGAYPLAAMQHGLDRIAERYGEGGVAGRASVMANNMHAFEILVGPYAVAHLRLTQAIRDAGGELPEDGVHVYLTDTLDSPEIEPAGVLPGVPLLHRRLAEEHRRAQRVKADTRVLVCMGNPPYDRQQIDPDDAGTQRKGGWVRFGDPATAETTRELPILEDFLKPVRAAGQGVHLKNLYNDYVYFWRWALWKVFESTGGPGIVSFISASSYLRGPGFVGMRQVMRQTFDELWILDLEGDSLGARKTENVFNIQTPVAIAVGVRYGAPDPSTPAQVRYTRITGTRGEKLGQLDSVRRFGDLEWQACFLNWMEPFLPEGSGDYFSWPVLTDLFPWQNSGVKAGRTWPIAETTELLKRRWRALVQAEPSDRRRLFVDRPTGRKVNGPAEDRLPLPGENVRIIDLEGDAKSPGITCFAFRSLDRQWLLADSRLLDRAGPGLWASHSERQVYLTSLLTNVLGEGPAATAAAELPDLHHFRGSFGGKDVIPLWRDSEATDPNVTAGLLELLTDSLGPSVTPEDLFAYAYAILATPAYVERFSEELAVPGPRIPVTKNSDLFRRTIELGRELIRLHTYGERYVLDGESTSDVLHGRARCLRAVPSTPEGYPESFSYDASNEALHVGAGRFGPVSQQVWEFGVSGLQVVNSWLSYRMKDGAGRKSSPLDDIRPERWTADLTEELLRLLWILETTIALYPELARNLDAVIESDVWTAAELPVPSAEERKPPKGERAAGQFSHD